MPSEDEEARADGDRRDVGLGLHTLFESDAIAS